jgi:predicted secreted protein with PEFG-CTERM motif
MKSKSFGAIFGLLAIIAILGAASEVSIMTASAQSTMTGRHCTASQPCVQVCGDHVCAPGELAQMTAKSAPIQSNSTGTSAIPSNSTTNPSMGVVVAGIVSYMDVASDGTAVIVRTGHPISGQPLAIGIGFKDANENFVKHQNYAITVTQDGTTVLSNPAGHTHTGTDTQTTDALSSNNPVNIVITLNGVGLPTADPSTWTGVKGEVLDFSQVTDVKAPTTQMSNMTSSNMTMTNSTAASAGNATVPEFGPVASIVLAIAVLSVVVFAAKTRVIPRL